MKIKSSDAWQSHEDRPKRTAYAEAREFQLASNNNPTPPTAGLNVTEAEREEGGGAEIVTAVLALAMLGTMLPYLLA